MRTVRSRKADIHGGLIMPQDKINLTPTYVVIGNGIAGVTAAEILRAEDSAADITVVGDDPFPVYYRPALKDYLAGRVREDKLWARPNSLPGAAHPLHSGARGRHTSGAAQRA